MNRLPIELVNIIYYKTYKLIYNDVIKDIYKLDCFIYAETTASDENGENEYIIEMDFTSTTRSNFLRFYKYFGGKVTLYDFIDYDVDKLALRHDIEKNVKKVLPVGTRVVRRVIKLRK
jgi:hypothetical protein